MGRHSKGKSNLSSSTDNGKKTKKCAKLSSSFQMPIGIKLYQNYTIVQKRASLVAIGQVVLEKKLTDI